MAESSNSFGELTARKLQSPSEGGNGLDPTDLVTPLQRSVKTGELSVYGPKLGAVELDKAPIAEMMLRRSDSALKGGTT